MLESGGSLAAKSIASFSTSAAAALATGALKVAVLSAVGGRIDLSELVDMLRHEFNEAHETRAVAPTKAGGVRHQPGVIDQDINPPEPPYGGDYQRLNLIALGDVRDGRHCVAASGSQLVSDRLDTVPAPRPRQGRCWRR